MVRLTSGPPEAKINADGFRTYRWPVTAALAALLALALVAWAVLRREPTATATFPAWCQHGRGAGQWCRWCQPEPTDAIYGIQTDDALWARAQGEGA